MFSGSFDVARKDRPIANRTSYLLCKGIPYRLHHHSKTAYSYPPTDGDLLHEVQLYISPIALLVDRKRVEDGYKLEITAAEEWYTYLRISRKKRIFAAIVTALISRRCKSLS